MSTFANRMHAAKLDKRDRMNRGEPVGNHGLRPLTAAELHDRDAGRFIDELEAGIAAMVQGLRCRIEQEAADLDWHLRDAAGNTFNEIPF
jgi:hypothetical protein